MKHAFLVAPLLCSCAQAASSSSLDSLIGPQLTGLVDAYKSIHSHAGKIQARGC